MKSRINLYVSALQPVKEQLPLGMSVSIIAVVLTLVIFISGGLFWSQQHQLQINQELSNSLAQEQQNMAAQATILGEINNNKPLMAQIALTKEKIKNKKRILRTLDEQVKSGGGFSPLLIALGDVSDGKVWLTQIKSQQGALTLRGSAEKSQYIPAWVGRLNRAVTLQGQSFSSLTMDRSETVVNFVLNNQSTLSSTGVNP